MAGYHSRAGVLHHSPDFFFHGRLIAVYQAFAARCLAFLKRTFFKPLICIIENFSAFGTESAASSVLPMTIDIYHGPDSLLFPGYSAFFTGHEYPLMSYPATDMPSGLDQARQFVLP